MMAFNSISEQRNFCPGSFENQPSHSCKLGRWSDNIQRLTGMTRAEDVKPAYVALLEDNLQISTA